jgi:hypothetical protein
MTEDDTLSRFVTYVDLNSRAQLLRDEFEVMYDELRIIAKVDRSCTEWTPRSIHRRWN